MGVGSWSLGVEGLMRSVMAVSLVRCGDSVSLSRSADRLLRFLLVEEKHDSGNREAGRAW